jgi:hypothetical protein
MPPRSTQAATSVCCCACQADLVEAGLFKSQWFVTGEVDPRLFSDSFAFKDESVATTGIKAYATGQQQQAGIASVCMQWPATHEKPKSSVARYMLLACSTAHCLQ